MRPGIIRVALIAAVLALLVFGAPLAYVMNRLLLDGERAELERLALRAAVVVPDDPTRTTGLPATEDGGRLGVYDDTGRRVVGTGPRRADVAVREALATGLSEQGTEHELVVAIPVAQDGQVSAVVRAGSPSSSIAERSVDVWAAMGGLALLSAGAALALAVVQVRRLAEPIEALEQMAEQLGGGNFSARAEESGVPEIDRATDALNRTAARLGDVIARERAFSAHASHQLRTPITGLRLSLESALGTPGADLEETVRRAVRTTDELARTVDDVLTLSRPSPEHAPALDLAALLEDAHQRWSPLLAAQGRDLRLSIEEPPEALASEAAVRQVVDVLLDNALRHGAGTVVVTAREASDAVAVDVGDEGSTIGRDLVADHTRDAADASSTGAHLGLALARRLAEAESGRLLHASTERTTRLTLLLPAQPPG